MNTRTCRRLALAMAMAIAVQPLAFVLCQMDCLPGASPAGGDPSRASVVCHEQANDTRGGSSHEQSPHSASSFDACAHDPVASVTRAAETLRRASLVFVIIGIGERGQTGTNDRRVAFLLNHAPPGPAASESLPLRL